VSGGSSRTGKGPMLIFFKRRILNWNFKPQRQEAEKSRVRELAKEGKGKEPEKNLEPGQEEGQPKRPEDVPLRKFVMGKNILEPIVSGSIFEVIIWTYRIFRAISRRVCAIIAQRMTKSAWPTRQPRG
jgi:hypothetical protein